MLSSLPFTSDGQIAVIAAGLRTRTLPKVEWTHAAHFGAALWLLARHPELEPLRTLRTRIRSYNEATGVENTETSGYHETITQASIRAARAFLGEREAQPLFVTCNELMASPLGRSDWLLSFWSHPRLFSPEARKIWVEPDLRSFPF